MNEIDELLYKLREIAKQNLIDRDWWGISAEDIDREVDNIVTNNNYGRKEDS